MTGANAEGGDGRRTLAELVRAADARGEAVERVRASYDRDVPPWRVRRLVMAERERMERVTAEPTIKTHAPRYVDLVDLATLTDGEFGHVVEHLLRAIEGPVAPVRGSRRHRDESGGAVNNGDGEGSDGVGTDDGDDDPNGGDENERGTGATVQWHRDGVTTPVRAVAAEPGRTVDAALVREVSERARTRPVPTVDEKRAPRDAPSGDGEGHRGAESDARAGTDRNADDSGTEDRDGSPRTSRPAIVTVADVSPGAVRLAVRSGVGIHDRVAVSRWLDEARLSVDTFGSLIEEV